MIEILDPGPLTTLQDTGRMSYAHLGVSRSGAADRAAYALANRLVGNAPAAAALEITLGGLAMRFTSAATIALTGAPCPGADFGVARSVPAGTQLRLLAPMTGVRSYLAIRGGIDVRPVLGSRSTDTLSGLGPAPLRAGDMLPVGNFVAGDVSGEIAVAEAPARLVHVIPGPRDDWFVADALDTLTSAVWTVRPESDRVGVRLDGPQLIRQRQEELPSEPTLPGALQVPADGRPIVLGPDAPVTGGYPVLSVVRDRDLDVLAQLRPGDQLQFAVARDQSVPFAVAHPADDQERR